MKTLLITGASRGIGRAIALRAAQAGCNIALLAKSTEAKPDFPSTIYSVRDEVEAAGGAALPMAIDIRDDTALQAAAQQTAAAFGGIDVVINNASAIHFASTAETSLKHYDLMMDINARGTFATVQACLPWLLKSPSARIITMSPPLNLRSAGIGASPAYALSKYGMSLLTLGFAREFSGRIAANTLWPATLIATDAIRVHFPAMYSSSRKPDIVAEAVQAIIDGRAVVESGTHLIDEDVLRLAGWKDFEQFAYDPACSLTPDLFLDA
jgi:citronellol/citronellal dehydrogenase